MNFQTLIDPSDLLANLGNPGLRIVDVRHQLADPAYGERSYMAGHLPGAVFMHCDRDLSGPMTGTNGRHPLPDVEQFARRLGELGVVNSHQVVVYDDSEGMFAGRLWWMLRWLGHEKVAVLDGGLKAWLASGGALTASLPTSVPTQFTPQVGQGRVDVAEVLANLESRTCQVIDARAADRFRGENETTDPVGGHIPGAMNRFFRLNLQENGRFKSAQQLRHEWLELLGKCQPEAVIHQCGSGVTACHNALAMEIAGLAGSRIYAGSWSEWCADPERPVARGE